MHFPANPSTGRNRLMPAIPTTQTLDGMRETSKSPKGPCTQYSSSSSSTNNIHKPLSWLGSLMLSVALPIGAMAGGGSTSVSCQCPGKRVRVRVCCLLLQRKPCTVPSSSHEIALQITKHPPPPHFQCLSLQAPWNQNRTLGWLVSGFFLSHALIRQAMAKGNGIFGTNQPKFTAVRHEGQDALQSTTLSTRFSCCTFILRSDATAWQRVEACSSQPFSGFVVDVDGHCQESTAPCSGKQASCASGASKAKP